eukprot:TRINITY_DN7446_c0_g1_i1.p1 TRINITY_DN7446_c0_g1~~TRINITY_DN7446_c0_g1_i1.p1  ORF type:complete len:870 (+),score=127.24 TRINITY_DN7446_c0_g1_i1:66-2675(+)
MSDKEALVARNRQSLFDDVDEFEYETEGASAGLLGLASYATFKKNMFLAISMGFWVTVFYIPSVCTVAHDWLFDEAGGAFGITRWIQQDAGDLNSYWPNVVQLMFFTVYFNTGSTVRLGWQGLAGTAVASINISIMGHLFPHGGKCAVQGEPLFGTMAPTCQEYADNNYARFSWFVWFDVFVVIFLLLVSNSEVNTKKFGLSWHANYMMAFMSPSGYKPSHSVVITSCFGVFLAILVTLLPYPHLSSPGLNDYPQKISNLTRDFIVGSLELVKHGSEWSRYRLTASRFGLENTMKQIPGLVTSFKEDFEVGWWETFNLGRFGPLRQRCHLFINAFDDGIAGFDDILHTMTKSVLEEKLETYKALPEEELREVAAFRHEVVTSLETLAAVTLALLDSLTTDYVKQGTLPSQDMLQRVEGEVRKVRAMYMDAIQKDPSDLSYHRKVIRTNLNMFVFSHLALAERVLRCERETAALVKKEASNPRQRIIGMILHQLKATWSIHFGEAKISFVARNFSVLTMTFVMGSFLSGDVFVPHNATMCSTLAVLITEAPGSHVYMNLMRLLGLTLGKVLPIILMAAVSLFGANGPVTEGVHLLAVFIYITYFSYVYYTSPSWSYVGCVIAGFGCYGLVGTTVDNDTTAIFVSRYQELGMVTAAMIIQMFVDGLSTSIQHALPRDIIVRMMERIGMPADMRKPSGFLVDCFEHFFRCDFEQMKKSLAEAKRHVSVAEAILPECGDMTIVSRGPSVPFRYELCAGAIALIKQIMCELDTILLCQEFSVGSDVVFQWGPVHDHYKLEVMQSMKLSLRALQLLLAQKEDGKIDVLISSKRLQMTRLDSVGSLRQTVASRSIHDLLNHVYEIEHLCFATGVFG